MEMKLFTAMPAAVTSEGKVQISQKFVDGVCQYLKDWPGRITVFAEPSDKKNLYMDTIEVLPSEFPFEIQLIPFSFPSLEKDLENGDLIVSPIEYNLLHLVSLSKKLSIPLIYITENTFKTFRQMLRATTSNLLLRWRRLLWLHGLEKQFSKAIKAADGIQCNGLPTYEIYRRLNQHALLFFDSRVTSSLLATQEEVENRLESLFTNRPLKLAFTGRLIQLKGVEHLIPIACELKRLGINFHLDICGEGELEKLLQEQISSHGLNSLVTFKGKLDFKDQLIPYLKANVDLFVCPHVQGDPSCTYLETMSCGIPIAGYANEALAGLVQYSQTGWTTLLNKPKLLAQKIGEIAKNKEKIREASLRSLDFASNYTFEKTFKARVQHFLQVLDTLRKRSIKGLI